MTLTLEQKETILKNKRRINHIVRQEVKKAGAIIFGARSVNKQVPKHLETQTMDFDIKTRKNPRKLAKRIERRLDKKFGGNFFEVKPAAFPGTHKVINRVSKEGLADVSKQKLKIGFVKRKGVKFANLKFQKKKIQESLDDPESRFRHDKDRFGKLRIKLAERPKTKPNVRRPRRKRLSTSFNNFSSRVGISPSKLRNIGL